MTKMIQTKNLSKSYGKTQVLKNIDLTVERGEFTAMCDTPKRTLLILVQ
ncbi:hypothetical protein LIT38_04260 [Bacillus sp. CMF12]|nr:MULTISPECIES: hypothetical protein [Bacillaceae]USK50684.1 hypothetical protein LIT38_04260 [Bacillus sp. CMF12]